MMSMAASAAAAMIPPRRLLLTVRRLVRAHHIHHHRPRFRTNHAGASRVLPRLAGGGGGGGGGTARVSALPEGTALANHPLMATKVGKWTLADFDLVTDEIPLEHGMGTAKIVRPASEDDVLDMYVELGLLDHDPYWAALWPSSIALARGVAAAAAADIAREGRGGGGGVGEEGTTHSPPPQRVYDGAGETVTVRNNNNNNSTPTVVVGRDVCDLGAGLGLAGIAAALCGARSVVFYDREPLALMCCLLSAEANGLTVTTTTTSASMSNTTVVTPTTPASSSTGTRTSGGTSGSGDGMGAGGAHTGCVCAAEVFDWHAVPSDQTKFDLVLACDVLYEASSVAPVAALVPALTKKPGDASPSAGVDGSGGGGGGGKWLLADPPRRAPANRARFRELVKPHARLMGEPRSETVTHRGSTDEVLLLDFILTH